MSKVQVGVFIILATLFSTIDCAVFPAGKCKYQNIDVIPFDLSKDYVTGGKQDVLYGPELKGMENVIRSDLVLTLTGNDSLTLVNTQYLKDKSKDVQAYKNSLVNGVLVEEAVNVFGGSQSHFRIYPLAITSEGGILMYRCADNGCEDESVDTRFILIPAGRSLSEAGLNQLLEADKKFGFQGSFYKYPNYMC